MPSENRFWVPFERVENGAFFNITSFFSKAWGYHPPSYPSPNRRNPCRLRGVFACVPVSSVFWPWPVEFRKNRLTLFSRKVYALCAHVLPPAPWPPWAQHRRGTRPNALPKPEYSEYWHGTKPEYSESNGDRTGRIDLIGDMIWPSPGAARPPPRGNRLGINNLHWPLNIIALYLNNVQGVLNNVQRRLNIVQAVRPPFGGSMRI